MRERKMMRRCLLVSAAIGMATGVTVAWGQQDVNFAPRLSEGQQFTYEIGMRLKVRQMTGDAPANEASTASTARMRFKVKEITEAGSAQVEMKVESVRLENEIGGETSGYNWPPEADQPEDELASLGEILAGETIELIIANSGEVTIVSELESFVDAAQEIAGSKSHLLLGLFNPATLGATLTPLFVVDGANDAVRNLNDQWQSESQAPIAPIGVMSLESNFTFTTFEDGLASYTGTTSFSIDTPDHERHAGTKIDIIEQSGEINGTFDTNSGFLRSRSRTMSLHSRWLLSDITMEQKQESSVSVTLIDPE